jgi:hypothetical protein
MTSPEKGRRHDGLNLALIAGLGLTVALFARKKTHGRAALNQDTAPLATYLSEHVAGADAAIRTVERLRRTQDNPEDRRLFSTLFDEFRSDRAIVTKLLAKLGEPPRLSKRLVGRAAGMVRFAAGGQAGELSLLRTLEALAIGVQGKRCLWRALQALPELVSPGPRTFIELESSALRQWELIEARRQVLARQTFGSVGM